MEIYDREKTINHIGESKEIIFWVSKSGSEGLIFCQEKSQDMRT